jgi:AcrR family transcriptional regulator
MLTRSGRLSSLTSLPVTKREVADPWQRLSEPTPEREPLSPEAISEVALKLADTEGLGAVTMRSLAANLGVAPMAIYRHAANKEDVVELMVNAVQSEMIPPKPEQVHWRSYLRSAASHSRDAIIGHPWLLDVSPRALLAPTPNGMERSEQMVSVLVDAGLAADTAFNCASAVKAYADGCAHLELADREMLRQTDGRKRMTPGRKHAKRLQRLTEAEAYPNLSLHDFGSVADEAMDSRFEVGLESLIDGIASRLGN